MWAKLIGLGVIEAALVAVLLWPVKMHAVKIDMAAPGSAHTFPLALDIVFIGTGLVAYALVIAALLAPIWMAYLAIRAARRLN